MRRRWNDDQFVADAASIRTDAGSVGRDSAGRGLTLLEVLIALGIFVSSIAVISQLLAQGVRGARRAQLETEAIFRAESKLAEVVAGAAPFQAAQSVPFPDSADWIWSLSLQPGPTEDLFIVGVTVTRAAKNSLGDINFTVSRLVRDPQMLMEAATEAAAAAADESAP